MTKAVVSNGNGRWDTRADDTPAGTLRAVRRPDGRTFLSFRHCDADAYQALLTTALAELRQPTHVSVPEDDNRTIHRLEGFGFRLARRDHHYRVPVDPARRMPLERRIPGPITLISAADADLDRLRLLDDRLRNLTPGTDGWRWSPSEFREEIFSDGFNPAAYRVAVDSSTASYMGLARIWIKASGPRFGYVGVLPNWQRTSVAHLLLSAVFGELRRLGHTSVAAEIDVANRASNSMARRAGAVRVGGSIELVRDPASIS